MARNPKIFLVILLTLGLLDFMGNSSVLMAQSLSHWTHLIGSDKGPDIPFNTATGCTICHDKGFPRWNVGDEDDPDYRQIFKDRRLFGKTRVCDPCHSPGGPYDGVNDPVIGAKANWEDGVYNSKFGVLSFWHPYTEYRHDDVVKYRSSGVTRAYICITDANKPFTSGASPNKNNWQVMNPWKPETYYVPGDFVVYNYKVYRCIGDDGDDSFTSGTSPNPNNWRLVGHGIEALQKGKEKWCAGCHDRQLSQPKSNAKIKEVSAPSVIADNTTYGFYVSGHGRKGIDKECLDCHNSTYLHIDGDHRTYTASLDNYKEGYRLRLGMAIPRDNEGKDEAFELCTAECHSSDKIFSPYYYYDTDFRDDGPSKSQLHFEHLKVDASDDTTFKWWDSDWDWDPSIDFEYRWDTIDSVTSCPACHNVHGSSRPRMFRDGELISTPGTTDKVPAFDFKWLDISLEETDVYADSVFGYIESGRYGINSHKLCDASTCHDTTSKYKRDPGGPENIEELVLWMTDPNNDDARIYYSVSPGQQVRFHMSFRINAPPPPTGQDEYYLKLVESGVYGTGWELRMYTKTHVAPDNNYHWDVVKTIPLDATPGSYAQYRINLKMGDEMGGTLLDEHRERFRFNIVE